jgi:hypothetical protein
MRKTTLFLVTGFLGVLLGLFAPPRRQAHAWVATIIEVGAQAVTNTSDAYPQSYDGNSPDTACGPDGRSPKCHKCTKWAHGECVAACVGGACWMGPSLLTGTPSCTTVFSCSTY